MTHYSLDYIHSAGRFGPAQILKALKLRTQGSLCLYGLPGTGKTQFAEHVAHELVKPILIKRASEHRLGDASLVAKCASLNEISANCENRPRVGALGSNLLNLD